MSIDDGESLYAPDDGELAFLKSQTGIEDEQALKEHIISVQRKAYEASLIFPRCTVGSHSCAPVSDTQLPLYPTFFIYEVCLNAWNTSVFPSFLIG